MGYTKSENDRIEEIVNEIAERRNNAYSSAFTYLDSPKLKEIEEIYNKHKDESDLDANENNEMILRYLAQAYDSMGRDALAFEYYEKMFTYSEALGKKYYEADEEYREQLKEDIDEAVRTGNAYEKNSCEGIRKSVKGLLPEEELEEIFSEALAHKGLNRDPVEKTKIYLDLADETDRYVEEHLEYHGRGSCHEAWALKKKFLSKNGIKWKSPKDLNPRVRFD